MIYIAVVGALTPFGQFLVQSVKQSKTSKLLFTVDGSYEVSKPSAGQYRTIDEALAEQHVASFYVIDVVNDNKTAERAMTYRFYGVSAIVCGLSLTEKDVQALEKGYHVRRRTFAPVVVEPQLSELANSFDAAEKEPSILTDMVSSLRKLLRWMNFGLRPVSAMKQVYYKMLPKLNAVSVVGA